MVMADSPMNSICSSGCWYCPAELGVPSRSKAKPVMRRSAATFSNGTRVLCCMLAASRPRLNVVLPRSYIVRAATITMAMMAVATSASTSETPRSRDAGVIIRELLWPLSLGRVHDHRSLALCLVPTDDQAHAQDLSVGPSGSVEDRRLRRPRKDHQRDRAALQAAVVAELIAPAGEQAGAAGRRGLVADVGRRAAHHGR